MRAADSGGVGTALEGCFAEKELARVKSRLVVNIHVRGIVGGLLRFVPPGIGEPSAAFGGQLEVGSGHVFLNVLNFRQCRKAFAHKRSIGFVLTIDECRLVVAEHEGARLMEVGIKHSANGAHVEQICR